MRSAPGHTGGADAPPGVPPCVPPGPTRPPAPAVGGSRQAGAALPWGNGEVGELVSGSPNPWRSHYIAGKHLICCLAVLPDEIQAKGAGWGASSRHPASLQVPRLSFMVPGVLPGVTTVAWGIPQRAACGHRSHPNLPRDWEMCGSAVPRGGFWGDPRGMGAAKGAPRPQPREGSSRGGSSRAGSTPRLCPGKDTAAGTSREGD